MQIIIAVIGTVMPSHGYESITNIVEIFLSAFIEIINMIRAIIINRKAFLTKPAPSLKLTLTLRSFCGCLVCYCTSTMSFYE